MLIFKRFLYLLDFVIFKSYINMINSISIKEKNNGEPSLIQYTFLFPSSL